MQVASVSPDAQSFTANKKQVSNEVLSRAYNIKRIKAEKYYWDVLAPKESKGNTPFGDIISYFKSIKQIIKVEFFANKSQKYKNAADQTRNLIA